MPVPILATKLYIPKPRSQLVWRSRLLERLNAGLRQETGFGRQLTLISAAAGFGKTTLASAWVAGCGLPTAWLALDAADNDPARFLTYLLAAVQTVAPQVGQSALALLAAPQPPPLEVLLTSVLNEIASLPEGFILVLDDYHAIDAQPIDQALAFLLQHQPPQLHLVIATREDPQLPLARLRARNQLTELRAADLRFTPAEATEFLNAVMGLHLTPADIAALEAHTEGWIAGLQLAALAMQGHQDTEQFVASFSGSHRFVLDYLLEEVLHNQPAATQSFLLRTAILDRLCGPLCDAVVGYGDVAGQEMLEQLERANLFIVPLDHQRRWYRYHHLFGELLRQRLGSPPDLAELHRRASRWHEENGDLAAAFHHARAAGDFERAARLAETAWQGMDDTFQTAAWLRWVNGLPDTVIRARPLLCTQAAYALMDSGDIEASSVRLQEAEQGLPPKPDPALAAMLATARVYNAQLRGDFPAAVQYAEAALQLIPADDLFRRAQATIMLEFSHWASGDLEAAHRAICDWMEQMTQLGNIVFVVASAFAAADILIALGRLGDAIQTYQEALRLADEQGKDAQQITAHHHLGLALLYREVDKADLAAHHLHLAAILGEQTTLVDWPQRWKVAQAKLRVAAGDLPAALTLLDEAEQVSVRIPVPDLRPVAALKARIYLRQGRLERARAWATARGLTLTMAASYLHEFELLTLARLHSAEPGVNELLARLLRGAEAQQRMGSVLEILLTQVHAYGAQGNRPQALAALAQAVMLAEPEGYCRSFVDEGEELRLLLLDLSAANARKPDNARLMGYVARLLAAFEPTASSPAPAPSSAQQLALVEPLSARELEILRLIALGLSNDEIGQRLFLALSTVKGHNLRIFGKLQVQNRTEAVARARVLGLI